ncbi:MAG: fatty acid desaturase, partial [Rhodobacteraceae bacterium]|nr:fatty acid desaturase [Paracoccaceae bacterium]
MTFRDYNLTGPANAQAIASGLVTEDWYRTPIDRKVMKDLMKRSDHPATRDTIVLFALMAAFASAAVMIMPSWWSVPFWMAYGVLYGSAMDARWHECGHGTAFKTRWKNTVVYH